LAEPLNYYKILGVRRNASVDTIKKAYRRLAMQHHPDRGGDQERFKPIQEAHDVLMDPEKKAYYDEHGTPPPKGPDIMAMSFKVLTNWFIALGNQFEWAKGPYVREIRRQNAKKLNELENQLESISQTKERVSKLSMSAGDAENPLGAALLHVKDEMERNKKQAELMLRVHQKVEELMESYEDDYVEPQQMVRVFIQTSSTSTSNTL